MKNIKIRAMAVILCMALGSVAAGCSKSEDAAETTTGANATVELSAEETDAEASEESEDTEEASEETAGEEADPVVEETAPVNDLVGELAGYSYEDICQQFTIEEDLVSMDADEFDGDSEDFVDGFVSVDFGFPSGADIVTDGDSANVGYDVADLTSSATVTYCIQFTSYEAALEYVQNNIIAEAGDSPVTSYEDDQGYSFTIDTEGGEINGFVTPDGLFYMDSSAS